jgi:hypothetical protein
MSLRGHSYRDYDANFWVAFAGSNSFSPPEARYMSAPAVTSKLDDPVPSRADPGVTCPGLQKHTDGLTDEQTRS